MERNDRNLFTCLRGTPVLSRFATSTMVFGEVNNKRDPFYIKACMIFQKSERLTIPYFASVDLSNRIFNVGASGSSLFFL